VIISVGSIDMLNGRERRQGLIDSLLDRPFKRDHPTDPIDANLKGAKYSVVATILDNGDTAKATAQIAEALRAHPDVKCVAGLFSYSAPAALAAIQQAGRTGQVQVVGFDETEQTQAGIESGAIHSSILQDQYRAGNEVIRALAEEVRGVNQEGPEGPRTINVQTSVLRKDNIQDFRELKQIRDPAAPQANQATTAPAGK
jgi:ribose transport system substrate-binding protein